MSTLILRKKLGSQKRQLLRDLKRYRIKISMTKPYLFVDFWAKKPDLNNALEVFMQELFTLNASEYFQIEVSED